MTIFHTAPTKASTGIGWIRTRSRWTRKQEVIMGSIHGLFSPEELEKLSDKDRKILREHILGNLVSDKKIKRMLLADTAFDGFLSGLSPKIRNKLRAKARPLKNRLTHSPAVEVPNNVTKLKQGGRD